MNVTIKELQKQEEVRNRAVIYARYSSDKQKDASIEQQIKECMDYITRKGYSLVRVYSDSAKSASKNVEKRSDFLKLIEESKYGEFDVVVSYALDRISREAHGGFYGYENALNKNGVRIEYATQVFDDGYGGEISKAVHVTMAAEYVAQLRKNVVRGMCDNAMKGNYNGGPCVPIGIKIIDGGKNNKRYALDEATAPFVRQVFEQYVMGKSTGEIAEFLNNNGIRNNRGGKITHETVNKMIENPLYKGTKISVFDNMAAQKVYTVEGVCEPIVSEDLWEQAQVIRGKRKYRGARADARVEYILRGKLFCGICGDDMIAYSGKSRNGEMHYYYACRGNRNNTGEAKCKKKNVSKTVIENAVMDIITDWIWDEDKIKEIIAAAREADAIRVIDPRIAQLQASIKKHKERKQRASEKYLESGDQIWADHVQEENDLLQADEKELAAIKRQEADPKTADEFIAEIEELRKCWSVMRSSDDGRKMIICNYVERIDVFNESPDEPGWIKIILTIRTDPVGRYSREVVAMIPVAVSGSPPMVHQQKKPLYFDEYRGSFFSVLLLLGPWLDSSDVYPLTTALQFAQKLLTLINGYDTKGLNNGSKQKDREEKHMQNKNVARMIIVILALTVLFSAAGCKKEAARRNTQDIIEEMVVDYASYGEAAYTRVDELLKELSGIDPAAGDKWDAIMDLWKDAEPALHYDVLPDGLNDTDALCIVVLGFQLEPDGSMREELIRRLETAKRSAEKYPDALIVCTGGGTAAENDSATEADKMAEWLTENGISPDRVIAENRSLTTAQNAMYTFDILTKDYQQVKELAIVSSDYHIATGDLLFGAEAILRNSDIRIVSNAAWKAPSGTLSAMFQAGALIELSGDVDTAFEIYYDTYDIHELPPLDT